MADGKKRDDLSRWTDNFRQLQEKLQNMEWEKKRQEKEMQERIEMLEMETSWQQEKNKLCEMEQNKMKRKKDNR